MADLYKGIEGSPITYLAADISADQTTISIADDSALPDAPNICTIGYGEHLETIKYETKSNGVLQNVTRGIEGTPRAWPAGTEVARFFTAYDHNAIIENFTSHLSENSGKHIAESGSNENGRYIKFDDGTVICYMTKPINYQTEPQIISFVYPVAMKYYSTRRQANKNVSLSVSSTIAYEGPGSENTVDVPHIIYFNATPNNDGTGCTVRVAYDRGSTTREVDLMVTVIGRWK